MDQISTKYKVAADTARLLSFALHFLTWPPKATNTKDNNTNEDDWVMIESELQTKLATFAAEMSK